MEGSVAYLPNQCAFHFGSVLYSNIPRVCGKPLEKKNPSNVMRHTTLISMNIVHAQPKHPKHTPSVPCHGSYQLKYSVVSCEDVIVHACDESCDTDNRL